MQAQVTTRPDGTVLLHMDVEAAQATFASVVFASRFHEGIREMAEVAKRALEEEPHFRDRREATCR
jgi:hypothetical protein